MFYFVPSFTLNVRKKFASQLKLPFLDYADMTSEANLLPQNTAYNKMCRFVLGCSFNTDHCLMYNSHKWIVLNIRRHTHWLQLIFKCGHFSYPHYLQQFLIPYSWTEAFYTIFLLHPYCKNAVGKKPFMFKADLNNSPLNIQSLTSFFIYLKFVFLFWDNLHVTDDTMLYLFIIYTKHLYSIYMSIPYYIYARKTFGYGLFVAIKWLCSPMYVLMYS